MTKYIFGVDPGSTESGWCVIDCSYGIMQAGKMGNDELVEYMADRIKTREYEVAIESIQSYGMVMGRSTIETAYMIGRLIQKCSDLQTSFYLYPRPEYGKAIICGNKVNDALVRSALENRFGGYKKDQPLFKLAGASDKRSAFAVACYHLDKEKAKNVGLD